MQRRFLILAGFYILTGCSAPHKEQTKVDGSSLSGISPDHTIDIADIPLTDLQGNPVVWEELRGKTIFLNFWATWCKPCIMEMPSIEQAYQTLKDNDVIFLAASYEPIAEIKNFQQKHNFSFSFVHLQTGLETLNIYSIPTTFIINKKGYIQETVVGSRPWDVPDMMAKLKQM